MKCSPSESLMRTADAILDKINHAFEAGSITKELLQLIAILSSLSDKLYAHIRSIISCNLTAVADVTKYGPSQIWQFLEEEQTLIDTDKSMGTLGSMATALVTKASKFDRLVCSSCKTHGRPPFTGYTALWCILEGGVWKARQLRSQGQCRSPSLTHNTRQKIRCQ